MLKSLIKQRPKQLVAVYVEPERIEVLRARRQWRSWSVESAEQFPVPKGEGLYDVLQRLNLKPRNKRETALVLFLPRSYYSLHREHYPSVLQDQLHEAIGFDWQENLFTEEDQSLHFFGPPVGMDQQISVPIFSLQRDLYDKFYQTMGAALFDTFAVIPSALVYRTLFTSILPPNPESSPEFLARLLEPHRMEIHRYHKGELLDSFLIGRDQDSLRLFRETLICIGNDQCRQEPAIHLLCSDGECSEEHALAWKQENLPLQIHKSRDPLLLPWVDHLFQQDKIETFNAPLQLKPWKVPKVIWSLVAMAALYAAFFAYQVYSLGQTQQDSKKLKRQLAQLETQWKPLEELQTRVGKFEEDRKTLDEFNQEGYPLLEILSLLTRITPEDTWLNYFSIRKGQMILRGESKSAIKYLSELSKVEGFSDVRFSSPVTRNPSSDMERFNVQVQIDLEKLKKTADSMEAHEVGDKGGASTENSEPASAPASPLELGQEAEDSEEPGDAEVFDPDSVDEEEAEDESPETTKNP